jgi:tripartite-type tricarboxylate transporter receptor subunit TctC
MRFLATLAAAALLAVSAVPLQAEDFPTKPITLVVPFPAGGATDLLMRALGAIRSRRFRFPCIGCR